MAHYAGYETVNVESEDDVEDAVDYMHGTEGEDGCGEGDRRRITPERFESFHDRMANEHIRADEFMTDVKYLKTIRELVLHSNMSDSDKLHKMMALTQQISATKSKQFQTDRVKKQYLSAADLSSILMQVLAVLSKHVKDEHLVTLIKEDLERITYKDTKLLVFG
jgi:hypothetical protein